MPEPEAVEKVKAEKKPVLKGFVIATRDGATVLARIAPEPSCPLTELTQIVKHGQFIVKEEFS